MSAIVTPEVELPTLSQEPLVPVSNISSDPGLCTILTITDPVTGELGEMTQTSLANWQGGNLIWELRFISWDCLLFLWKNFYTSALWSRLKNVQFTQFLIYVNMCLSKYNLIFSNLGVPIGLRMAPEPQKSQPYLRILEQPKSNALRWDSLLNFISASSKK